MNRNSEADTTNSPISFPSHRDARYRFIDPRDLHCLQNTLSKIRESSIEIYDLSLDRSEEVQGVLKKTPVLGKKSENGSAVSLPKKLQENSYSTYKVNTFPPVTRSESEVIRIQSLFGQDYFLEQIFSHSGGCKIVEIGKTSEKENVPGEKNKEPSRLKSQSSEATDEIPLLICLEPSPYSDTVIRVKQGVSVQLMVMFSTELEASAQLPAESLEKKFQSTFLELEIGEGAQVQWVGVYSGNLQTDACIRVLARGHQNSRAHLVWIERGGRKTQTRWISELLGTGAEMETRSAVFGQNNEVHDFQVSLLHEVPHTKSDLKTWMMVDDQAKAAFNGVIEITSSALATEAYQQTRGLLLSPSAVIENQPKLEISTDEVKCAHGAAISPVNEDQLFYMQSRGISKELAEAMIIDGFAAPLLENIQPILNRAARRYCRMGKGFKILNQDRADFNADMGIDQQEYERGLHD